MHVAFVPYGKRSEVELLLCDMDAQKHQLPMWKGKKKQYIWIQGQVRQLPFGVHEYVCPKEDMNKVLTTLGFAGNYENLLGMFKLFLIKNALKLKEIPDFKKDKVYLWVKDNVNIIPLGIKEDPDLLNHTGKYKGWTHEAI